MLIERLQQALPHLERLSEQKQEQEQVASLIETLSPHNAGQESGAGAQQYFGAWSDLPESIIDEWLEARHDAVPTAPADERLSWLDPGEGV
jgi:hypothetical protein